MSLHAIEYDYSPVPTVRAFAQSDAFIRGLLGPFGSGKSSGCVIELIRRAQAQTPSADGIRHSRWAVIRNTYSELQLTTTKTLFQWLPPHYCGRYVENKHTYNVKCFAGVDMEVIFLALDRPDDVAKLLSLELTGAWLNEAREIPWSIVDAIQGRVGRFPRRADAGDYWSGIWMDTNPPDSDSKWYAFFEEKGWEKDFRQMQRDGVFPPSMQPEGYAAIFKQPAGDGIHAENLINLPKGYYQKLGVGKSDEWKKIYIRGDYGFVVEGKLVYPEYVDKVHCKAVDPVAGRTIIRSWDFGLCYSDDTEVLTNNGWKLFKDVDEATDLAASRNPETGEMAFAPIAFKIAKPFKGELLHWKSTELDMLVTPEHRVPYTHRDHPTDVRWAAAEWLAAHLGRHHMVDLLSAYNPTPTGQVPLGTRGVSPEVYAAFMGLYLAEGCTYLPKGKINIYQKRRSPDLERILMATGLPWRWAGEGGKASGWWLTDHVLTAELARFGLAKEKFAPPRLMHLGSAAIRAFIDAYTRGDGHIRVRANGATEHTIFTSSKRMADDLQTLAQLAGWNSSIRKVKPQTSFLAGRRIDNTGGFSVTFKKRASRAELHRRSFRRVAYDGLVYCLNVPWHTLYVRRGGKPHWNGNTPACIFSQELPDGRWLTFDEMVSDNMAIDKFSDDVLEHCHRAFRGQATFEDWGDPAGQQRAQTDKRTCFEIMQAKDIMVEGSEQDPTMRQEAVRSVLRRPGPEFEGMFILHPRCKVLRKGFMGGYHRRRLRTSGAERYSADPEKNLYSHPHDALQYAMVKYFAPSLRGEDREPDWPPGDQHDDDDVGPRGTSTGY